MARYDTPDGFAALVADPPFPLLGTLFDDVEWYVSNGQAHLARSCTQRSLASHPELLYGPLHASPAPACTLCFRPEVATDPVGRYATQVLIVIDFLERCDDQLIKSASATTLLDVAHGAALADVALRDAAKEAAALLSGEADDAIRSRRAEIERRRAALPERFEGYLMLVAAANSPSGPARVSWSSPVLDVPGDAAETRLCVDSLELVFLHGLTNEMSEEALLAELVAVAAEQLGHAEESLGTPMRAWLAEITERVTASAAQGRPLVVFGPPSPVLPAQRADACTLVLWWWFVPTLRARSFHVLPYPAASYLGDGSRIDPDWRSQAVCPATEAHTPSVLEAATSLLPSVSGTLGDVELRSAVEHATLILQTSV